LVTPTIVPKPWQGVLFFRTWTFTNNANPGHLYNYLLDDPVRFNGPPGLGGAAGFTGATYVGHMPVQGNVARPLTFFTNHDLVDIPGVADDPDLPALPGYYDPSFGEYYATQLSFQQDALSGVAINAGSRYLVHSVVAADPPLLTFTEYPYAGN
jgi:hypothetical protein